MRVRARTVTKLPASLSATGGLKVEKDGGEWTFAPDWSALDLETTVPEPENRQLWTLNPITGVYTRLSVQALIDNLPAGPQGDKGDVGPTSGVQFVYDTATGDSDPGDGKFRLNNASIASVTQGYFDNTEAGGATITAWLDSLDDSTNTAKGFLSARGIDDPLAWAIFSVSGSVVDGTGYRKVTLTYIAHSGTWTNGHTFAFNFTRSGDKGTDGDGAGDVVGPSSSVDDEIALFDSTTGKLLKRATTTGILKASSGVIGSAVSGTDYLAPSNIGVTVQAYDANTAKLNVAQTFTAKQTFGTTTKLQQALEQVTITAGAPASTQNFNALTQAIEYFTSNTANNWTLNVRGDGSNSLNSIMATGEALTIAIIVTNGSTAYRQTAMQIDGSAVTPQWLGAVAPSAGTINKRDTYTFTIIKTASATFIVQASFASGN